MELKALVVEDCEQQAAIIAMTLRKCGVATVHVCGLRSEGMRLAESGDYAVAVIDLRLPDGTGMDILRYLTENKPDTATLIVSALGDEDTVCEAIEYGANDFLIKPRFTLRELRKSITEGVHYYKSLRRFVEARDRAVRLCSELSDSSSLIPAIR